jgi:hypothetical protein
MLINKGLILLAFLISFMGLLPNCYLKFSNVLIKMCAIALPVMTLILINSFVNEEIISLAL